MDDSNARGTGLTKADAAGDWVVEGDDHGGRVVRHRHWDVEAVAYLYSNPDEVWAECTMCGATLALGDPARVGGMTRRDR